MKNTKKITTVVMLGLLFAVNGYAQSLKDMKKMVKESVNTKPDTAGLKQVTVKGGESAYTMIEAFMGTGKKFFTATLYRTSGSNYGRTLGQYPELSEAFFKDLKRNDKNQIVSFSNFTPNESAFPLYYKSSDRALYFIGEYGFSFRRYFINAEEMQKAFTGNDMDVIVYAADKGKVKKITQEEIKNLIVTYLTDASKGVNEARANEKAAADKAESEKRAKYTTQGKAVTKIRIVQSSTTAEQGKTYVFTIIATLKDGSEISTEKGGYTDEYIITATGLPETYDGTFGKTKTVNGNTITIPENAVVNGDKIVITVKSKYHATLSATATYTMDYSNNVVCDYNAYINSGSGSQRTVGGNLRIEIKGVKHGVSGAELLEYKVFGTKGNLLRHFRVANGVFVTAQCDGQKGWKGQNGTDGGNITIVLDPSVKSYNLNTSNKGGQAGAGGYAGSAGTIEKLNQKVSW